MMSLMVKEYTTIHMLSHMIQAQRMHRKKEERTMKTYTTPKMECVTMTLTDVIAFSINTTDAADYEKTAFDIRDIWDD